MSNTIFTEVKEWVKPAQLPKGFLSHPSGGRQSAQWSRGTNDRLESDTSKREAGMEEGLGGRIEMSPQAY